MTRLGGEVAQMNLFMMLMFLKLQYPFNKITQLQNGLVGHLPQVESMLLFVMAGTKKPVGQCTKMGNSSAPKTTQSKTRRKWKPPIFQSKYFSKTKKENQIIESKIIKCLFCDSVDQNKKTTQFKALVKTFAFSFSIFFGFQSSFVNGLKVNITTIQSSKRG